jgi:hypothetical protein
LRERLLVPNGNHNETWHQAGDSYWEKIGDFVERCYKEGGVGVKLGGNDSLTKEEARAEMAKRANLGK